MAFTMVKLQKTKLKIMSISDAILNIGAKLTDSATAGFSYEFDIDDVVMLNHHNFKLNETVAEDVTLPSLMDLIPLIIDMRARSLLLKRASKEVALSDDILTQSTYFDMMQHFIKDDDVLLAEQGTSFFGAYDLALPKDMTFIGQPLWGSIGYTLPATLGTQMADPNRRNILLIGDGSLQLTVKSYLR